MSSQDSRKKAVGTSANGKFLKDLETISNAIYVDKSLSRLASSTASSRSKSIGKLQEPEAKRKSEDAKNSTRILSDKDKKSSIWSWKGLKALTQARNRRFDCRFSLLVHSVEGLPAFFNGTCLVVHWKRRDGEKATRPVRVSRGVAEFEEKLIHSCSVYGSRSGPHNSAKYEAKHFLLYVSIYDASELDLGKHRVDLTRLLPLKMEELEENGSSGKWTTSFRLSGKARGATMNVSFGYVVIQNNNINNINNSTETEVSCDKNVSEIVSLQQNRERGKEMDEGVKDLHQILPIPKSELCDSVNILYRKLDEEISNNSPVGNEVQANSSSSPVDPHEQVCGDECEIGVSVINKRAVELENVKPEDEPFENVEVAVREEASLHASFVPKNYKQPENTSNVEEQENITCSKESLMKELEAALIRTSDLANEEVDSQEDETDDVEPETYSKVKSDFLDDVTESVANDFLEMLGIEHNNPPSLSSGSEPGSPRERLLREFEKDALANGGLLNIDIEHNPDELVTKIPTGSLWGATTTSDDFQYPSVFEDFGEMCEIEKTSALRMEGLETETLMREWGLNEKAFQHSSQPSGFGSPIDVPLEDPQPLPPLAEGLGHFARTENGGFVRSMNPALFMNGRNSGSLIMQVSNPVVVPAEMGSGVMDILQVLASVGIEKLSMQANKLMPLEDINGNTIQQIAWESAHTLEGPERQESEVLQNTRNVPKSSKPTDLSPPSSDSEYVSLDDLAPLAMDKIEALSIEGLRIQSGMSGQGAPSNISAQSVGEFSALKGKTVDAGGSIGLDGTCGLQLLDIKDNGQEDDDDGLMGLSLTLDEWVKLDSGEIGDDVSERTSEILAAHHATSLDVFRGRSKGEKKRGKNKKYGLLGNNFTVALMVQLRDPLRDYEAVGTPMLALIQVERVFVPPKPRIYSTVSAVRKSNEDENETVVEKPEEDEIHEEEEEVSPRYKVTEVHVAGLKSDKGEMKSWGSSSQQKSGSRWLLANGMGKKNNKNPVMKSKAVVGKHSGPDTLWSISSRVRGTGAKWK
ncbi:hypothetical protein OROGR_006186 [Orobanche gracilis]